MAGRKPDNEPGKKVDPMMPPDAYASLQMLAEMGRFGKNPNEVARYLLLRELDDLTRTGVLPNKKISEIKGSS
jgi:hypothetical protein